MDDLDDLTDTGKRLLAELNQHGYGFQARALKACHACNGWHLKAAEFPVQVHGRDYHVDGVLEWRDDFNSNLVTLAAVECKRADPNLAKWCFATTVGYNTKTAAETFTLRNGLLTSTGHRHLFGQLAPLSVAVEVSTTDKGNGKGKTLNDAVTQALRGASGIAEALPHLELQPNMMVCVLAIVITTARLYVGVEPLETANLSDGHLRSMQVSEVPWLWHAVHASRSLMPEKIGRLGPMGSGQYSVDSLRHYLSRFHARAVAIVNVHHIAEALLGIPQSFS